MNDSSLDQGAYFVTIRLADSLPHAKLQKWNRQRVEWLNVHPQPWSSFEEEEYHHRFIIPFEDWLDEGAGSCILKHVSNRILLEDILRQDDGKSVRHHGWIIMPNHAHLLFTPAAPLDQLMKSWKNISSRKIGIGPIWQQHYRESMIRDMNQFTEMVRYIQRNPMNLPADHYSLWLSEATLNLI